MFKNHNDEYDSKTGIFKRTYFSDSTFFINQKINLTDQEKKAILISFQSNGFESMPKEIDCNPWYSNNIVYYSLGLDNHIVNYSRGLEGTSFLCYNGKAFVSIHNTIKEILYKKTDIKKMEESKIIYE